LRNRKYTNEFKLEAVRLAEGEGVSAAQVARDLGIHNSLLYRWIEQFGTKPDGTQVTPDEHEELIRLRREIKTLREERDILKKATAFFAKESK
jgi:transposase